jgi:MFS family permease
MAIALGPIVGGWLLEQFSWSSIFYAMAPVAALGAALAAWSVPTSRDPSAHKFDLPGLVLSSAAMAVLIYTLIEAPSHGWSSGRSVTGYVISAVLAAVFVVRERGADEPMLDVSLFRNPRFAAASGSVTVVFFGLTGFSFLITQYFQFFKRYAPLSTGVHLLPVALAVGVMAVVGTKLAVSVGTKQIVSVGMFCLAGFFAWVSRVSVHTGYLEIAGQMVLGGSGVGLVSAPATEAIMGGGTESQGRHRFRGQRCHPPAGQHARHCRDRQRLRVDLPQPCHRSATLGAGSAVGAYRPGLGRRRAARCLQP